MNKYLKAKLVLFKDIIKNKSFIISDKEIKPFKILRAIAKRKKIKLLEIEQELKKIKKFIIKTF